ncbi:hypothetical protein [Caminibacter sp.]
MGAYLMFEAKNRKDKKEVAKINKFLEENEINKKLGEIEHGGMVFIYDNEDIKWAKEHGNEYMAQFFKENYGRGDYKVSGLDIEIEDLILELLTKLFEELNKHFEMRYYAGSCAFTVDEDYFTIEQMKRITNNGELLSGRENPKYKILKDLLGLKKTA